MDDVHEERKMIGKERQNGATVIGKSISVLGNHANFTTIRLVIPPITIKAVYS